MPEAQMRYIGGVEGGGTKSTMILMNTAGEVLAESHGPTLNQWLIGLSKACAVLNDLVNDCKQQAGIATHTKLTVLGIAVSGSDSKQSQIDMESYLHTHYPNMAHQYVISSDTIGSIATAFPDGGMAIISGTGSNCEVVNPDGSAYKVGGWGHMLADKGSAYWISHYCIRKVFEVDDNFHYSDGAQDVTRVKQIMLKYFNIKDRTGLLEPTYASFEKCRFAGMCKHISECAINTGDALCIEAFNIAGRDLARHIISILPKLNQSLVHREGGIQVVCVGSVWNSWQLLKTGFLAAIDGSPITELTLYLLDKPSSHGAAAMGAKACNVPLHMDYSKNTRLLYHYTR